MPVNEGIPGFHGPGNLPTDDGETDCPDCREHEEAIGALLGLIVELEAAGDAMAEWVPLSPRARAFADAWHELRADEKRGGAVRCGRCSTPIGDDPEICWYCQSGLCDDCWETPGHCGHPEADEANRRAREVGAAKAHNEVAESGGMAPTGRVIATTVDPKLRQ